MAVYRMTPARRAALEKAQAASARKRRKLGNRSRLSRLTNRKTLAVIAVGTVAAHKVYSDQRETKAFLSDPVNEMIINRHTELARYHNFRLNELRLLGIPPQLARLFDEQAARREAIEILSKNKRKKKKT